MTDQKIGRRRGINREGEIEERRATIRGERGLDVEAKSGIIVHTGTVRGVSESVLARISLDRDLQSSKGKATQLGDIL
ncbi:hypothetical protein Sjap_012353 [Stephania japonica]|uniref:Uncharacterized protein n=1 Tax=Stephania japonica TaxID=461633 RepID=A0AAP0IVV6_9MAGN